MKIITAVTVLLLAGGTLYTFDRAGQATYNVALRVNDIEMAKVQVQHEKVEVEKARVLRDLLSKLPPPEKPSIQIPGGGNVLKLFFGPPVDEATLTVPLILDNKLSQGLSTGDGKQVLDSKEVLPPDEDVTPELPHHPPLEFIPQIPVTSP